MLLTKEQISEQMCKHTQRRNGLHELIEMVIESMLGVPKTAKHFFS